jgi:hypothetical protein
VHINPDPQKCISTLIHKKCLSTLIHKKFPINPDPPSTNIP